MWEDRYAANARNCIITYNLKIARFITKKM